MFAAFKVLPPSFKCFNNYQQLTVVGLIPNFSKNHLSGKKDYWMPLAQIIRDQLIENSTNSLAQSIYLNLDITLRIKMI